MNVWSVDLNSLRALHALLDTASVTQAAHRLGITQPAASAALRRLRRMFDDPLLVRSGRSLVRSSRGEELLIETRAFLASAERVLTPAASLAPSTFRWSVRLGADDHVAAVLLGPLDTAVRAAAPGVDLTVSTPGVDPFVELVRGELDLLLGPFDARRPDLHAAPLFDDPFVCVLRAGHPAATGELTLNGLAGLEHVQVGTGARGPDPVDAALAARHRDRRVTRRVPTGWLGAVMVARSDLAMVVPRSIALTWSVAMPVVLRALPMPLPPVRVQAVWHDRVADDPRLAWLLGEIRAVLG